MATYESRALEPNEAAQAVELWNRLTGGTFDPETMRRTRTLLVMTGSTDFSALVLEADEKMVGIATVRIVSHPVSGKRGDIEAFLVESSVTSKARAQFAKAAIQWLADRDAKTIVHLADADTGTDDAFWPSLGLTVDKVRWAITP